MLCCSKNAPSSNSVVRREADLVLPALMGSMSMELQWLSAITKREHAEKLWIRFQQTLKRSSNNLLVLTKCFNIMALSLVAPQFNYCLCGCKFTQLALMKNFQLTYLSC